MYNIGSLIVQQNWYAFDIRPETEAVIVDYRPLSGLLDEIKSFLLLRRFLVIGGIPAKDEPFKTLPKLDNELIIFPKLSSASTTQIQASYVEVIKVYKPTYYAYVEPNWSIDLYGLP